MTSSWLLNGIVPSVVICCISITDVSFSQKNKQLKLIALRIIRKNEVELQTDWKISCFSNNQDCKNMFEKYFREENYLNTSIRKITKLSVKKNTTNANPWFLQLNYHQKNQQNSDSLIFFATLSTRLLSPNFRRTNIKLFLKVKRLSSLSAIIRLNYLSRK